MQQQSNCSCVCFNKIASRFSCRGPAVWPSSEKAVCLLRGW